MKILSIQIKSTDIEVKNTKPISMYTRLKATDHFEAESQNMYSPLLPTIRKYLCDQISIGKEVLDQQIISDNLTFSLIQHKGCRFLSDLNHTIQLIVPQSNLEAQSLKIAVSPTNSIQNSIYQQVNQTSYNFWEPYNCNKQDLLLLDPLLYPHPYTPEYFMGKSYDQFIRKKPMLSQVYLSSRTIRIHQWRIKIVNVSKTGWYAPTIEALQYKIENPVVLRKQNFGSVTLVLYEPEIKETMQEMRLKDLRDAKKDKFDRRCSVSLTFFVKEQPKRSGITNIVRVDKNKQILKFDSKRKMAYIPFGHLQSSVITTEKLDLPALDIEKIKKDHLKNWQILMNAVSTKNSRTGRRESNIQQELLNWSDEGSEDEGSGDQDQNRSGGMLDQSLEECEPDSDDDVLTRLYKQQLKLSQLRIL